MVLTGDGYLLSVTEVHQHMAGDFRGFDPGLRQVFERVERHLDHPLSVLGRDPRAGVELLDTAGVDIAWVLAEEGPPSGFGAESLAVADYCGGVPDRLVPIGCVNPKFRTQVGDRVARMDEAGIRGVKLCCSDHDFSPLHPGLVPVYDWLAEGCRPRYDERATRGEDLSGITLAERAELHQHTVWVAETCQGAVNELFRLGGASSIYEPGVLQRVWRDVNVLNQHIYLRGANHRTAGQALLGFDVPNPLF